MFVKKPIPSLCKLFRFTKKYRRSFWTKLTQIFFYRNNFVNSQSHHQTVRVSKSCSKNFFNESALVLQKEDTAALYPLKGSKFFRRDLSSLVDSFSDFLKTFDEASNCSHIIGTQNWNPIYTEKS